MEEQQIRNLSLLCLHPINYWKYLTITDSYQYGFNGILTVHYGLRIARKVYSQTAEVKVKKVKEVYSC